MRIAHLALAAALISITTGCAGKRHFNAGLDAELGGQDWVAAQEYAEALSKRPKHDKTRKGVLRTAEQGFFKGLAHAEKLERRGDHLDARQVYLDLDQFIHTLEMYDLLEFDAPDVLGMADSAWELGVQTAMNDGRTAISEGQFQEALDRFEWVAYNEPGTPGLLDAQDAAWSGWADQAEERSNWRLAIARHKKGHDNARAAQIHEALGEWFVRSGSCRAAATDYEAAISLERTKDRMDGFGTATECATHTVSIESFSDRSRGNLDVPAARILRDQVLAELDPSLSEYVQLTDGRTSQRNADYTVHAVIHHSGVDNFQDVAARTGTGTNGDGEVRLNWTEVTHTTVADLHGTVRITDPEGHVRSDTFHTESRLESRWAVDLRGGTVGVTLPYGLADLLGADRTMAHPRDAAYAAIDEAAIDIATYIGSVVDVEDKPKDPRNLDLPDAIADGS